MHSVAPEPVSRSQSHLHDHLWLMASRIASVNSTVLITNGLSFAIQAALFLVIGSFADYGRWRPYITIVFTILTWAVSFAWLGVQSPEKSALPIAISYSVSLTWFPPQMADRNRALYRWVDWLPILFDLLDRSFPRASKRLAGIEGERREIEDWRD